jgi:hypothetical protein
MLASMLPQAADAAIAMKAEADVQTPNPFSATTYRDEKDKFEVQVPDGWTLAIPEEPYDR